MIINNLYKRFGSKTIFENKNFIFENGKITYILGESGVGKTTLLRILAGLDNDYSAEIIERPDKSSYVFQEPRLFPSLTVSENIGIVNESSPYSVDEMLKLVEMLPEKNAYPDTLSGGMKMRVALARAIYNNADLYLMDEPFSALNDELKERILPRIFEYLKGKTVIIVSHNVDEANSYANAIIKI